MLRSAVNGQVLRTAHRRQTVYHGAVVYSQDPYRRLERASSVLEFDLLLFFMEPAVRPARREYRFVVWAQDEPSRARVDLQVSPALLDALQNAPRAAVGGIGMSAGVEERALIEEWRTTARRGFKRTSTRRWAPQERSIRSSRRRATTPRAFRVTCARRRRPMRLPRRCGRPSTNWILGRAGTPPRGAWRAEPVVRHICSTYGGAVTGVRVSEDSFIVVKAEVPGHELVEVTIAVGPDGTCACQVSTARGQVASASPHPRALEHVLTRRLVELGVRGRAGADPG